MRRAELATLVLMLLAAAAGCATSPAPERHRRTMEEAMRSPLGAWANVTLPGQVVVSGELLAVSPEELLVASPPSLVRIPQRCLIKLDVAAFETSGRDVGLWGGLGTLSSLSHGYLLIFSAPIWILTTAGAGYGHSRSGHLHLSRAGTGAMEARPWARFPQGPPPRFLERAALAVDDACHAIPVPPLAPTPAAAPPPPPPAPPTPAPGS